MTFGRLYVENFYGRAENTGKLLWSCSCDCGNEYEIIVLGCHLNSGHTQSCGCYQKDQVFKLQFEDLTNKKFSRLVAKNYVGKNRFGASMWFCECDCGGSTIATIGNLKNGNTNSCGCYKRDMTSKAQLINLLDYPKFERLTVTRYAGTNKSSQAMWECLCDCGNSKIITSHSLISGHTKSCGCLMAERIREVLFKDINGQSFGILTVREYVGKDKWGSSRWLCDCECGRTKIVGTTSLNSGKITSCGCLTESYMAFHLKDYFLNNFAAIPEYNECINPKTGYYLPYDIYIPEYNIYVEVQGLQHYEFVKNWHVDFDGFEYQKYKDFIKREHALDNGIFIEIDLRKVKTPEEAISMIENLME
jgi:hypothetical protein